MAIFIKFEKNEQRYGYLWVSLNINEFAILLQEEMQRLWEHAVC